MTINGVDYPVIGKVTITTVGHEVPIPVIKMMSDERWRELTETPKQKELRKKFLQNKAGEFHG